MPDCVVVVTVTPEDGHWRLSARGARSATCGSLRRAEIVAQRLTGPGVAIDVQVSVDGLEDLCADAVELGRDSDAAAIQALRLKRLAVRALTRAGVKQADIGYLLGISTERADDMRSEPVDSPWMARGQTPWRPRPDLTVPEPAIPGSRRVVAVVVTRAPAKTTWFLHLDDDEPERVRTLAVAEARVRELVGADTDVLICPVLSDDNVDRAVQESSVATAEADDLHRRTYGLRLSVARKLRGLGIGYRDIGDLLEMHVHRVRRLLE